MPEHRPISFPRRRKERQAVVLRVERLRGAERGRVRHQRRGLRAEQLAQPADGVLPAVEDLRPHRGGHGGHDGQARADGGRHRQGQRRAPVPLAAPLVPRREHQLGRGQVPVGRHQRGVRGGQDHNGDGRRHPGDQWLGQRDRRGARQAARDRKVRAGNHPRLPGPRRQLPRGPGPRSVRGQEDRERKHGVPGRTLRGRVHSLLHPGLRPGRAPRRGRLGDALMPAGGARDGTCAQRGAPPMPRV
mmetsp:Transcript_84663/g.239871  ORF Transcript_84663/g.239871 Transcript_84663/m.239871 type:complete len:245 (-) Transcript_84663:6-740(-)